MNATASEVEARFAKLDTLTWPQYRWLIDRGVPSPAIVYPEMPAHADVVFHSNMPFFDFPDEIDEEVETIGAMILLARDEFDSPCDLVAWQPKTGQIAPWFSSDLPMLGLQTVYPPRVYLEEALKVHPTPLEWLRAGREGVVILKPLSARWYVEHFCLKVDDAVFGWRLRDSLRWHEPRIFVECAGRASA